MKNSEEARHHLHRKLVEIRDRQKARFEEAHAIDHEIMRDFDRAVIIHDVLALLEGRDPKEAAQALWGLRVNPKGGRTNERI